MCIRDRSLCGRNILRVCCLTENKYRAVYLFLQANSLQSPLQLWWLHRLSHQRNHSALTLEQLGFQNQIPQLFLRPSTPPRNLNLSLIHILCALLCTLFEPCLGLSCTDHKENPIIFDFFGIVQLVFNLIEGSPKRHLSLIHI